MKAFILIFTLFELSAAQTISEMQNKILTQLNKTSQEMRVVLRENIPPINIDGQSALSSQLNTANNMLNKFKNSQPFRSWMSFFQANTKAISSVPVILESLTSDEKVNENLDADFLQLRQNVTSLYGKAAEEVKKSACPSKVIAGLGTYTDSVIKKFSTNATQIKESAIKDLKERRALLKKNVETFNNLLATCNSKPKNEAAKTCILDLLQNQGSGVTDYYESLGEFIGSIVTGYNANLKELSDVIADNMKQDFEKLLKVPCITRRS